MVILKFMAAHALSGRVNVRLTIRYPACSGINREQKQKPLKLSLPGYSGARIFISSVSLQSASTPEFRLTTSLIFP
jgi:hypothetical protein